MLLSTLRTFIVLDAITQENEIGAGFLVGCLQLTGATAIPAALQPDNGGFVAGGFVSPEIRFCFVTHTSTTL